MLPITQFWLIGVLRAGAAAELLREAQRLAEEVLGERWPAVVDVALAALDSYGHRLAGWEVRRIIRRALEEGGYHAPGTQA